MASRRAVLWGLIALATVGAATLVLVRRAGQGVSGRRTGSEACSSLFDWCVRGTCTAENPQDRPVAVHLDMTMEEPGRAPVVHSTDSTLGPRERRTIIHDFPEAHYLADHQDVTCRLTWSE